MKRAKIRVCNSATGKVVEVVHRQTAYLITASEPRKLMREARKFAKAHGFTIVDIVII